MPSKNDPRSKRSSSRSRRRREEQLDLFPHDLKLAPATSPLGGVRRVVRKNETNATGAPIRLALL